MADKKEENKKADVSDTKTSLSGVKTEDSERKGEVESVALTEAANRDLQDRRLNSFGDKTSSSGEQNVAGQHGRDGGEINQQTNNPAPSEDVISGERADDMNTTGGELQHPHLPNEGEDEGEIKKL